MTGYIKHILKRVQLYHPLQSLYRQIISAITKVRYRNTYRKYAGGGFTCNVCGATYRQFVPDYPSEENKAAIEKNKIVAGYGGNIFCPWCMSTARERLVIAYLKDEVDIKSKKILHILKEHATVITADLEPGFYKTIDNSIEKQDATQLGYNNDSFDIVIANHVFEHIPDDRKAMQEIFRVMKPGAVAILQVPYSEILLQTTEEPSIENPQIQSALYGQKDHVRIYLLNDYISLLRETGFFVEIAGEAELKSFSRFAVQPLEKLLKIWKPNDISA